MSVTLTHEYRTEDKTSWGPGPWQDEPDKAQWTDEATGLPCLMKRNRSGALCGYVGVPEGHPVFGVAYDDVRVPDADGDLDWPDVHGGLTYANHCQEGPEERTICHIPAPGEPDSVWWLGFDCAHYRDLSPAFAAIDRAQGLGLFAEEEYRTLGYVQSQCARLARQLAALDVRAEEE